jgi:hypothetical protein
MDLRKKDNLIKMDHSYKQKVDYSKSSINKFFDKWLKKEYEYNTKDEYNDAIVEVAIEYDIETPLSNDEKTQVLKDKGVI